MWSLAGVPRWLTDKAKERAKEAVLKGISQEGLAAATEKALKFWAGYGISEDRVIALMGKPKHQWTSEDIATLRGMASQFKDGQATAEQLFPPVEANVEERPKEETNEKRERLAKTSVVKSAPSSPPPPPRAAKPAQLEAILSDCLEKKIDLELILTEFHVSSLEELDYDSAQAAQKLLASQ